MSQDVSHSGSTTPAFFFHLGDVVYNFGEGQYYYDQFHEPFRSYDRPIFAIPGNHDGSVFGKHPNVPQVPTLAAFLRNFCATTPGPISRLRRVGSLDDDPTWRVLHPRCVWGASTRFRLQIRQFRDRNRVDAPHTRSLKMATPSSARRSFSHQRVSGCEQNLPGVALRPDHRPPTCRRQRSPPMVTAVLRCNQSSSWAIATNFSRPRLIQRSSGPLCSSFAGPTFSRSSNSSYGVRFVRRPPQYQSASTCLARSRRRQHQPRNGFQRNLGLDAARVVELAGRTAGRLPRTESFLGLSPDLRGFKISFHP
jgi:hypothetical protein